jgi:hypothetical protein
MRFFRPRRPSVSSISSLRLCRRASYGLRFGLNSAVARTEGLIATALLGAVLAASGSRLLLAFHVGAVTVLAASLSALLFIGGEKKGG